MKSLKTDFINMFFMGVMLLGLTFCTSNDDNTVTEQTATAPNIGIHEAVFVQNEKAVKQHIAAKTDLNQKDDFGSTPLNIATTFGSSEIAKLLIDGGADIEAVNGEGSTPLHVAAFLGRKEIVKALIDAGANPNVTNNYGSTPLASITVPFEMVKPAYDEMNKNLGPFGLKIDYDELQKTLPEIVEMLEDYQK